MSEIAIRADNLSKRYRLGRLQRRYPTLRDALAEGARGALARLRRNGEASREEETLWALKAVSFEVKRGEVVGVIGRNGAGKSTLLKVLSRITEPSEGLVELHGRVGSLLEVGTGFHPELTGRENIYLNGAILGMKRAEIERKFDEIVAFAEMERFLDTPVKHYSSGMSVRLAFAVAAHLEPEILVVDEVLAVGDLAFQKKCLGKMGEVAKAGRTVLFVSHSMAAIENFCERTFLLDKGRLVRAGETSGVIHHYLKSVLPETAHGLTEAEEANRSGNGRIRLTSFHIEDETGHRLPAVRSGMNVVFVFGFKRSDEPVPKYVDVGFGIHSHSDQLLFVLYSSYTGALFEMTPPSGEFRCRVERLPLTPGRYYVRGRVTVGGVEADFPRNGVGYFDVEEGDFFGTGSSGFGHSTLFFVNGTWEVW